MYFQIIERQGQPKSVITCKNLAEAKEKAKQIAIEYGHDILHICKKNEWTGSLQGREFARTTHTIRIK